MKAGNRFSSITQTAESVRKGDVRPIYLFTGDEDYLVFEARKQIVTALRSACAGALETVLEGDACSADSVIRLLRSPSLFNPVQIIIVQDAVWFEAGKSSQSEPIREWLSSENHGGFLVITAASADNRLGIVKQIKKNGIHLDFTRTKNFGRFEPRSDEYFPVARERLKGRDQTIEDSAWRALRQRSADSLWAVINALDVVSAYVGTRPRITISDVEQCIGDHSEMPGYMVAQAFGDKDPVRTRDAITKTLTEGIFPLQISKMLSNRIRLFTTVLNLGLNRIQLPPQYQDFRDHLLPELVERYQERSDARELLSDTNPYALYQLLQQSKRLTGDELSDYLMTLAAIDKSLKSGTGSAQPVLETLVYRLFRFGSRRE